jgi:hypothetical protein
MIETMKQYFSTTFVIMITLALLFVFHITGTEANPHDVLAPALEPLLNWIHGAIFPCLFGYWTAAFFINRL